MSAPTEPQPVEVTNQDPMPVTVADRPPPDTSAQIDARALRAAHTATEDSARTEDQRKISAIWERTQQTIAILTVFVTVAVAGFKAVFDALQDAQRGIAAGPGFLFLVAASNLVIGFYFGRTNHQRVGGDPTAEESRSGR